MVVMQFKEGGLLSSLCGISSSGILSATKRKSETHSVPLLLLDDSDMIVMGL